jgi:hypothetical protein
MEEHRISAIFFLKYSLAKIVAKSKTKRNSLIVLMETSPLFRKKLNYAGK